MKSFATAVFLFGSYLTVFAVDPQTGSATLMTEDKAETWRPLFTELAAQAPVLSTFVERRHFAFRKEPIVLEGELRVSPEHGLSLRYTEPKQRIMIIDKEGVLLRDHRGRSRSVPRDSRVPDVNAALLPILTFDLDRLIKLFEITASGNTSSWVFDFAPRDEETKQAAGGGITVFGEDVRIRKLEFSPADSQRIEIYVTSSETDVSFSQEEVMRFFR